MIQIDEISGFEKKGKTKLSDMSDDYFVKLHPDQLTNPLKKLRNSLVTDLLYQFQLQADHRTFIEFLIRRYNPLIKGTPRILNSLKNHIHTQGWQQLVYEHNQTTDFGKALLKAFGYKSRFRSDQKKGIWLARVLNIKSCPYCNSQYTLFVQSTDGAGLAKFQFDHFYPKDRYPYFSVSLFNLVPSCSSCNHKKRNSDMNIFQHYHPYYNAISPYAKFVVKFPDDVNKWNFKAIRDLDPDMLMISFVGKYLETDAIVKEHDRLYDISIIYERHKDIAHELLVKSILYNQYYRKGTRSIKGLFPDNKSMLQYILGNYLEEKDTLNRPLSKFTQDIAKQLNLI